MSKSSPRRNLRFDRGFWRYFCPSKQTEFEITSLIRREKFHPGKVARALGISIRSLERTVRQSLEISAGNWLRRERVVMVRLRLREGASLKELTPEAGYAHQTDLGSEFKKLQGMTPSSFRKIAQIRQNPDLLYTKVQQPPS
jgi:AraC-like DNA-binding protein